MKRNPFDSNSDEASIWEMLVARDIEAFVRADWSLVENDFLESGFCGVHGHFSNDVDDWTPAFPNLGAYKNEWLRQALETQEASEPDLLLEELHALTTLERIDVNGEMATAHKKFDGTISKKGGSKEALLWQTLYVCKKTNGKWQIHSFVGYLPHGKTEKQRRRGVVQHPETSQHKTAGPYSPVVRIARSANIIVLSGQAPVNDEGDVFGETLHEQAKVTLDNCVRQLEAAGARLEDVFKVMVYLADLSEWESFNQIYRELMPFPYPARTAVQAVLLPGFKVEVDMWAAVT